MRLGSSVLYFVTLFTLGLTIGAACDVGLQGGHALESLAESLAKKPPKYAETWHVDVSFEPRQLALLGLAADRIHAQTRGLVTFALVPDLTPDNAASLVEADANVLVNLPEDSDLVTERDSEGNGKVLGLTTGDREQIYIVAARLGDPTLFLSVAMHEMMHAVGLRHTQGRDDLMYPYAQRKPSTCLHKGDIREMCSRALDCGILVIAPCG